MSKNLRNTIISLMVMMLCLCTIISKPVFASSSDMNEIYNEELSVAIISGDGSEENPYIIDEELAPYFNEYLEEKGQEILSYMEETDEVVTAGTLDGVLSGTSHSGQTDGAYWIYKSGKPSVSVNGNIWMKKVEYLSKSDVVNMCAGFSLDYTDSQIKTFITKIIGKTLTAAVSYLMAKGFTKIQASAFAHWIGCGSVAFSITCFLAEWATFIKKKPYNDAYKAGKGLIHAEYNTSYQGSWYSHSLSEVWSNYPKAKEPKTAYGKGTFTSR